jgi:HAD superfamily hydrolase (TIGR01549 family)
VNDFDTAVVDIDGTLIDSTYHHIVAWSQAFAQAGIPVESWRLHRHMGMGGDRLIAAVTNDAVEASMGDTLRTLWRHNYDTLQHYVRPLDGANELLQALASAGLKVVIASSGDPHHTRHALRILQIERSFPVIDADDAPSSKPAPDLIKAAVTKVGGERAVMIGDTQWDVEAALSCGHPAIALCTGGVESTVLSMSAAAVFATPRDLAERLDEALTRASTFLPSTISAWALQEESRRAS